MRTATSTSPATGTPAPVPSRTPDVTVTVIVYNDAGRLPRAVASALRQSHANIEVVISDDHSTDATEEVARELAAHDPRVVYLRLPENSGGCSAPRNRALEIARAPYLMFLDSDDELPERAVEVLLAAHRERDLDFAMGAVHRIREDGGRRTTWMPHLVAERRTLDGIEADPRLLFEHLSTSKMYARAFLDRHGLRFPEGIHYEDQLFSAQAYCLAKTFTVVPEPVYRWYIAPYATADSASISNQRHKLTNVRDRVHVQRLIDAFLAESGHEALREDKDFKFLKHDFRMYAGDLPYRDDTWLASFADLMNPYLDTLAEGAYARLPRAERVVLRLLRDRRLSDVRTAARGLGHDVAPRRVTPDEQSGRVYWGEEVPASPESRRELDLTDLDLDTRPFFTALLRHEITEITRGPGASVDLTVRTYDPALRLPVGPQRAVLHLSPGPRRLTVPFRLSPVRPGLFEGRVRLDLAAARLPLHGFAGTRHPVLRLRHRGRTHTGILLAPLAFPPLTARVPYRTGLTPHRVTLRPEGHNPGRLQITWQPVGTTAKILGPAARRLSTPRTRRAARLLSNILR
ncbi:glycosyltransferase family 2 protein [Streptomyces violaceoruber]|uniref:Transferase n=3 Tax=Streptomyces TaxID=1883 RepID=A0ABM5R626_STRLI|nr:MULTISPECIES: glycosyltransferase family 2 protein [Streptomyces]QSJ11040.1 transferase [Streptomyces lividans]AIJ15470.1 transferase [Streptomyces lividans TK24]EFD68900.1 transferase [Streptomyces lividans TK24]EOY48055.1 putative CDP-glycosylpolyol phosphate:glycosylpolyol glycosylpolyolphosphotransferase [Streptomyces lividans 1326]KKD11858.1 transferase [Streptomyces sp. WM6391]